MEHLLDETDFEALVASQAELDTLQPELEKAQAAGIDVSVQMKRAADTREKIGRIRSAFFPGR